MKSVYQIFLILAFGLFSCSTVDNTDDDESIDIAGVWELSYVSFSSCPADIDVPSKVDADNGCFTIEGETSCISLVLNADGTGELTFTVDGSGSPLASSYTLNEANNTVEVCFIQDPDECSIFVIRNDELYIENTEEGCEVQYVFEKV